MIAPRHLLLLPLLLFASASFGKKDLPMKTFTYKTVGDLEIKADVYGLEEGGSKPVILLIHGGALIVGHRGGIRSDQVNALVEAGYTVISIDYRLAPETKIEGIIADLRDSMTWIRDEGPSLLGVDPSRLGVMGHSAGGYLTLMSGVCSEVHPKALVPFYGYGDIVGPWYSEPDPHYNKQPKVDEAEARSTILAKAIANDIGLEGRGRFYLYCRQYGLWPDEVSGHSLKAEPEYFVPYCPLQNVTPDYPPTLLLHGDNDTDVPYEQSVLMAAELKKHGVTHELITVPGGPHGFDGRNGGLEDPENRARFDRVLAFLKKHLE